MLNRLETQPLPTYIISSKEVRILRRIARKFHVVPGVGIKHRPNHGDVGTSFRSHERTKECIAVAVNRAAAELRAARAHIQEAMSGEPTDVSLDLLPSQEQPTPEPVKPEPLLIPFINFAPPELRQMATT